MKGKLRQAFFAAIFSLGAGFGSAGAYLCGREAVTEFITHKAEYDSAKACVARVKDGRSCNAEQYVLAAMYADQKKEYGLGLSWLFGGASFVRISLPKIRRPRAKPDNKTP